MRRMRIIRCNKCGKDTTSDKHKGWLFMAPRDMETAAMQDPVHFCKDCWALFKDWCKST